MTKQDLLLEIGCEELPSHAVKSLADHLADRLQAQLTINGLTTGSIQSSVFATPRRLAVCIYGVSTQSPAQTIERLGPSSDKAFSVDGKPTAAALGFAKSCGVAMEALTQKDQRLYFKSEQPGRNTLDILPEIIQQAVSSLPIAKPMRWGNYSASFARPVHWILCLLGADTVRVTLFNLPAGNQTFGHRFHHPGALTIHTPQEYADTLRKQGYVIADFNERRNKISHAIRQVTPPAQIVEIDPDLLNEVTALVEWPIALLGHFNPEFLAVPQEALITSMKINQKYFPIFDDHGRLQPAFVLVSNIAGKDPALIIHGNERVLKARLSDAAFFYKNDREHSLASRLPQLGQMTFQKQLGSLADKTERLVTIAAWVAERINADVGAVKQAAQLAKCDLLSEMVGEFPTLQGTMGYYYALHDGLGETCANAIKEHYLPRYFDDILPSSKEGYALALADRLDSLIGIFGINQAPTGDKDPFALRRAANGILQMLIARKNSPLAPEELLTLDLVALLEQAKQAYAIHLPNTAVVTQVLDFTLTRLKSIVTESDNAVTTEQFESVLSLPITCPYDFVLRLEAVREFQKLPEAAALAAANKRVANILKKQTAELSSHLNETLFECPEERDLAHALAAQTKTVQQAMRQHQYTEALSQLAHLKNPVDAFFDKVMVMVEDSAIRNNRLALLKALHNLLIQVADISWLRTPE